MNDLEDKRRECERTVVTHQEAMRASELKIARVTGELEARTREVATLTAVTKQNSASLADATAQRVQAEDESKSAQRSLQVCQEDLSELKGERKEQHDKLETLNDDLFELQSQQTQLKETHQLLDERIHRYELQAIAFDSDINTLEVEISALQLLLARHEANEASAPNVKICYFLKIVIYFKNKK